MSHSSSYYGFVKLLLFFSLLSGDCLFLQCSEKDRESMALLRGSCVVKTNTGLKTESWVLISSLPLNYFVTQEIKP